MRFFIEIDVPEDGPTISYTTDPLERCIAVATEVEQGHLMRDCTVYTLDLLQKQLADEAGVQPNPPCESTLSGLRCQLPAGHGPYHKCGTAGWED